MSWTGSKTGLILLSKLPHLLELDICERATVPFRNMFYNVLLHDFDCGEAALEGVKHFVFWWNGNLCLAI